MFRENLKPKPTWLIAAASCWIVASTLLAIRFAGQAADDFFITYRYAQNLVAGDGFVFNPGERIFGTTEPGLGLLLALLHAVTRIPLPVLGTILTAGSLVALAVTASLEIGPAKSERIVAIVGGSLLIVSPFIWVHQGCAAPLVAACLAFAALLEPRRPGLSGILAGFTVWCRPDALVGVAVIGCLGWFERRRFPRRFAIGAGLVILLGVALAFWYFGTALPGTLEAKQGLAERTGAPRSGIDFWPSAWPLWRRTAGPWALGVVAAAVPALIALARFGGRVARLLGWNALGLALAYPFLGVPFMNWYVLPCVFAVLLGLPRLAAATMPTSLDRPGSRLTRWLATALAAATVVSILVGTVRWLAHPDPPPRQELYRQAAGWLSQRTQPQDLVAHTEVGTLAFYGNLRMLDLAGLVSPEVRPYLTRNDYRGLLEHDPARFVLVRGDRSRLNRAVASPWFARRYVEAARWRGPRGEVLVAYERHESDSLNPVDHPGGIESRGPHRRQNRRQQGR